MGNIRTELDIAGMQILEEVVWVQLLNIFKFACHCFAVCAQRPCHLRVFQNQACVRRLLHRSLSSSHPRVPSWQSPTLFLTLFHISFNKRDQVSCVTHDRSAMIGGMTCSDIIATLRLSFCGLHSTDDTVARTQSCLLSFEWLCVNDPDLKAETLGISKQRFISIAESPLLLSRAPQFLTY